MSRDKLLLQAKEREAAFKEFSQNYKVPANAKYFLYDDSGEELGFIEYDPKNDMIQINAAHVGYIEGYLLKPLIEALIQLRDE